MQMGRWHWTQTEKDSIHPISTQFGFVIKSSNVVEFGLDVVYFGVIDCAEWKLLFPKSD